MHNGSFQEHFIFPSRSLQRLVRLLGLAKKNNRLSGAKKKTILTERRTSPRFVDLTPENEVIYRMSIKKETELAIFSHVRVPSRKYLLRYSCMRSVFQGKPTNRDEFYIDVSFARSTAWRKRWKRRQRCSNRLAFGSSLMNRLVCFWPSLRKNKDWILSSFFFFVDDSVRVIRLCWVRPVTQMYIPVDRGKRERWLSKSWWWNVSLTDDVNEKVSCRVHT